MIKLEKISRLTLGTFTLLSVVMMTAIAAIGGETKSMKDVYEDSIKLYNAGQYAEAKAGFDLVLSKNPRFVYARNYSVKCQNAIAAGKKPVVDLSKQLAAIKIPSVDFAKTELGDVLDYISQKCEELSGGKVSANIIYQGSQEDRKNKLVTLKMRDTPITEVIDYVGRLTGTKFKYEQYAIVGTPIGAAGGVGAASVQPATPIQGTGAKKFDTFEAPPDPFKK